MGTSNFNLEDITTWWKCVPEPEQQTLVALAELAQTPTQVISWTDIRGLMFIYGATPLDERTTLLMGYWGLYAIEDDNPLCGDENGCIVLGLSPYLGQIWACRLTGGCAIGSPLEPPCFFAITAPRGE